MNSPECREVPLVFDCCGESLVGIAHVPQQPLSTGILCVIAGGPQYRAGVGRNMVSMARELSAAGVPVFRFDHRGLGDSSGPFAGFETTGDDIRAAVECFRREVPAVRQVVLWGGCDAASGCMIHACDIPGVASMVLGNPWVTTEQTQSAVRRQHYLTRLSEWSFWRKLLRFEYDIASYVRAALGRAGGGSRHAPQQDAGTDGAGSPGSWIERMLDGLQRFEGPVLFLMSGQSLVSREFDELVSRDKAWAQAYSRPANERIDLPDADQTFSTGDSRERVNEALLDWVKRLAT